MVSKAVSLTGNDWQVVFANQNIPRLVKPYILLNVTNIDIPDHMYYSMPDASGQITMSGWRKASAEIQVFHGLNSLSAVSNLAMILQSPTMIDYQTSIDCSIGHRLFIGYVPELLNNSQWEGRGIYHFEFYYTESVNDNSGNIDQVVVHGDYIQTNSDTDPYLIFDPQPLFSVKISCDEIILGPDADGTGTTWDEGDTGWDKDEVTAWDDQLNLGAHVSWDDETTTWDDGVVVWYDGDHNG
jgi:hypothetical protein